MKKQIQLLCLLLTLTSVSLMSGCGTLFKATVTLTQADDAIMKEFATQWNDGKLSDDVGVAVANAQNRFVQSCAVAKAALSAYKDSGDKAAYLQAFNVAKAALPPLLEILKPFLGDAKLLTIGNAIESATKP